MAVLCLLAGLFLGGLQSGFESRQPPVPTTGAESTPYPPPPFPNGDRTPIASWPLFDVTPAPTPVATERAATRLARPEASPDPVGSASIRAIVRQDDVLWVATDAGLLRWNPATLVYDRITVADGLGSTRVNDIAFAPRGTVWAATTGGLSRYTPGRAGALDWTTHTTESTDGGLVDDHVVAIALDAEGRAWAGTARGLSRFTPDAQEDALGGTWKTIAAGSPDAAVHALEVDAQNTVWVASEAGLFRASGDTLQAETAEGLLAGVSIAALGRDSAGRLWVATGDGRLIRYEADTEAWASIPNGPGRPAGGVRVLAAGNMLERMWVATEGGLGRYHQVGESAALLSRPGGDCRTVSVSAETPWRSIGPGWQTLALPERVAAVNMTALALDQGDVLWVGTTNGLFRTWEAWEDQPAGNIGSGSYRTIVFDDDGNLWAPNEGRYYDGERWTGFREIEDDPVGAGQDPVVAVVGDGAGGAWVAHRSGTISHFDGEQWRSFAHESQDLWSGRSSIAMARDPAGGLWVGARGLVHVTWRDETRSDVKWRIVSDKSPLIDSGLDWGRITGIAVDNLGGVWVSTDNWGLVRYADGSWTAYPDLFGRRPDGRPERVTPPVLDAYGRLWTAGPSGAMARFDGQMWRMLMPAADLADHRVSRFVPNVAGGVWALHSNGSLSYSHDPSWWIYTQADGLPEEIHSIALNPISNRLWLSAGRALLRFDGARWEQLQLE
jgi:ligand-binding sensor domain-containing protein